MIQHVNNMNLSCKFSKVDSFFHRTVSSTYYIYFQFFKEICITCCTV